MVWFWPVSSSLNLFSHLPETVVGRLWDWGRSYKQCRTVSGLTSCWDVVDVTAAIQCLKRKKLYEVQVEQLGNFQLRIHDQVRHYINVLVFPSDGVKVAGCWNWKYWLSTVSLLFIYYYCEILCNAAVHPVCLTFSSVAVLCADDHARRCQGNHRDCGCIAQWCFSYEGYPESHVCFLFLLPQYLRLKCHASACFSYL